MMAHQEKPPLQRLAHQTRVTRLLERGVLGLPLGSAGSATCSAGALPGTSPGSSIPMPKTRSGTPCA